MVVPLFNLWYAVDCRYSIVPRETSKPLKIRNWFIGRLISIIIISPHSSRARHRHLPYNWATHGTQVSFFGHPHTHTPATSDIHYVHNLTLVSQRGRQRQVVTLENLVDLFNCWCNSVGALCSFFFLVMSFFVGIIVFIGNISLFNLPDKMTSVMPLAGSAAA